MPQSFASLQCHIVFSTKNREPLIKPEVKSRLFDYIGGILKHHSSPLIASGGMPDHVHLLVSLSRTTSIADVVRLIKSNSSGWMHDELLQRDFQWQSGYGAFAVSYSNVAGVKKYIANQAAHHRVRSFQEEFRGLLERHGIEWDERYVWD